MAFDDQFWRALADYGVQFPDANSLLETGSTPDTWCAREAGVNAGESPVGAIRRFSTEDRANCVAARWGGEQAWSRTVRSQ